MQSIKGVFYIFIFLSISACTEKPTQHQSQEVKVSVSKAFADYTVEHHEFFGRFVPSESAKIISMIDGFIETRHFDEGSEIKEGDILYKIDSKKLEQLLKISEANLRKYESILSKEKMNYERAKKLHAHKHLNDTEFEEIESKYLGAKAEVDLFGAEVGAAKQDLAYSVIRAPISGKIGISNVHRGEYIRKGDTLLAEIIKKSPMYVEMEVPQSIYNILLSKESLSSSETNKTLVSILDPSGEAITIDINFSNNRYSQESNSIKLRGVVQNQDGLLIAGGHTKVIMRIPSQNKEILVDKTAIKSTQGIHSVYIVENGIAKESKVEIKGQFKNYSVISKGLASDEVIIVDGMHLVKSGDKVSYSFSNKELAYGRSPL